MGLAPPAGGAESRTIHNTHSMLQAPQHRTDRSVIYDLHEKLNTNSEHVFFLKLTSLRVPQFEIAIVCSTEKLSTGVVETDITHRFTVTYRRQERQELMICGSKDFNYYI